MPIISCACIRVALPVEWPAQTMLVGNAPLEAFSTLRWTPESHWEESHPKEKAPTRWPP